MPQARTKQKPTVPLRDFKTCFVAYIGQNPETHEWAVILTDVVARKQSAFTNANLKGATTEAYKRIKKRELHNRKFPPPPESQIISLEQEVRHMIVGPNGEMLRS